MQRERGLRPALFFVPFNLAPVSFTQLPVVVHMHPAVSNPVRARMRWSIVVPTHPHIVIAIPTVISGDPYKARLRRWTGVFHNDSGRAYANHDLRV